MGCVQEFFFRGENIMPKGTLFASNLGLDSVLDTEHLDDHGTADGIAVDGRPVNLSDVSADNENSYGRRLSGQAFFAFGGNVGFLHA
ncbi:MAG TPA: hypothetical protein DCS23_02870 [Candidatus Yonathbacteria bacterium]|nr:hypothetical protein [Candidatus Yonathbacteria bacterium]